MAKKKKINGKQVEKLAALGCTNDEIAAFFDVSAVTLEKRFLPEIHKGREMGKLTLRQLQWRSARQGNVAMLIWLGKQKRFLGQSEHEQSNDNPVIEGLARLFAGALVSVSGAGSATPENTEVPS